MLSFSITIGPDHEQVRMSSKLLEVALDASEFLPRRMS